ncbi:hypothetical protein SLS63_009126 [Diaporthe eres]|uniref:Heterokaryon incompatibility domain-containing protein n=1 Tax=Diaporthe eres TaxID=83184 RepID=A0ABR1P0P4_DIAER
MNDQSLRVRPNCEFALKQAYWYKKSHSYLYRKWRSRWYEQRKASWYSKSRYFWLDAICIDQTNLREKSKQVAMMGSIYKKASHVLACIGDHADDSLFFFQSLYGLAHYVIRPKDMLRYQRFGGAGVSLRFRLLHRHSTTHRFVLALARLALRPYFTRMWILQELQLAQHTTILCGDYALPNEDALYLFGGLLEDLQRLVAGDGSSKVTLFIPHSYFVEHRFFRRHVNHGFPSPLWHGDWMYRLPEKCMATLVMLRQNYMTVKDNTFLLLKEVVSRLQCADPRDKVYGIISLIDWGSISPLEPDYMQNDVEVAIKFIEAIMKLEEAKKVREPIWKYVIITIRLLSLNIESRGVAEALEARCGAPEDCAEEPAIMSTAGSRVRVQQHGWRLSQEDIDRNTSKLEGLHATPPKFPHNDVFFLPRWAREDDWVIEVETRPAHDLWYDRFDGHYQLLPSYRPLLIMREGTNGRRNELIGYGFYSSLRQFGTLWFREKDHTDIDVYFDIEDAILCLWKMKQLYEMNLDSTDWMVPFLDTGVCRQQAPGSSYAVLPPNLPVRTERVEYIMYTTQGRTWFDYSGLKNRHFVLFDTKARRGWLVNGEVVALQLLRAYLRNIPQTEPFDFSRLNHSEGNTPEAVQNLLYDQKNRNTPIFRVLQDIGEAAEGGESSTEQSSVERKLLGEILDGFYDVLLDMHPRKPFPGEAHYFFGIQIEIERHRNMVMKGWDFDRIYRTNKAKVYTHVFEQIPAWNGFVKDLRVPFIFGNDLGEILHADGHRCPYFKTLPTGQDYLAVAFYSVQKFVDKYTADNVRSEVVARLSDYYAWEHSVDPFSHRHGQGDHLEQVDSSCFPVQRIVKVPHIRGHHQEKEMALLKKRKPRLYSSQNVEDFNPVFKGDVNEDADSNPFPRDRPPKAGMIVFGKPPDGEKLRQLAQANSQQAHPSQVRK